MITSDENTSSTPIEMIDVEDIEDILLDVKLLLDGLPASIGKKRKKEVTNLLQRINPLFDWHSIH